MPEKRLERTRKAYDGYRYWPPQPPTETPEGATLYVNGREYVIGPSSAAYRITQAQLAADERTAGDERL